MSSYFSKRVFLSITLILFLSIKIESKTHTDKTFLMPRSVSENLAMNYCGWHNLRYETKNVSLGGMLYATAFYQESKNRGDLGKYFGYKAENQDHIRDYISIDNSGTEGPTTDTDAIWAYNIAHLGDPAGYWPEGEDMFPVTNLSGKIKLNPKQTIAGFKLNYFQSLSKILKNLYIEAELPIAKVKNKLNPTKNSKFTTTATEEEDYQANFANILDYFAGNLSSNLSEPESTAKMNQKALEKAKIVNCRSKTELTDIDIAVGYRFIDNKKAFVAFKLDLLIPTGNKADGQYLFEPIAGNGDHWGLGGTLDTNFKLYKNKCFKFSVNPVLNLKYLFETTEKRTVGIEDNNHKLIHYGHYYLGGEIGKPGTFPLANVLTRNVEIKPGFIFEGLLNFTLKIKPITFDFGYSLYAKEEEGISLKSWDNDKYGIANYNYEAQNNFTTDDANLIIQKDNIETCVAKTPSQLTQKIHAGLGLKVKEWKNPVYFGIGSSYEFASDNSALEGYALWTKFGLVF